MFNLILVLDDPELLDDSASRCKCCTGGERCEVGVAVHAERVRFDTPLLGRIWSGVHAPRCRTGEIAVDHVLHVGELDGSLVAVAPISEEHRRAFARHEQRTVRAREARQVAHVDQCRDEDAVEPADAESGNKSFATISRCHSEIAR